MEDELRRRIEVLVNTACDDPLDDGGERLHCKTIRDWWAYTQLLEAENDALKMERQCANLEKRRS